MPARARDLRRALEALGATLEPRSGRSGTSHWMATLGGVSYPIPLHNGLKTEVPDVYIRGVCRALGLNEAQLRAKL